MTGPGDRVAVRPNATAVELEDRDGVAGALVDLGTVHGDVVSWTVRGWLPLHMLAELRSSR